MFDGNLSIIQDGKATYTLYDIWACSGSLGASLVSLGQSRYGFNLRELRISYLTASHVLGNFDGFTQ
jgi:hypothetical protein